MYGEVHHDSFGGLAELQACRHQMSSMKIRKKLALLLAFVMVFALVPATVFGRTNRVPANDVPVIGDRAVAVGHADMIGSVPSGVDRAPSLVRGFRITAQNIVGNNLFEDQVTAIARLTLHNTQGFLRDVRSTVNWTTGNFNPSTPSDTNEAVLRDMFEYVLTWDNATMANNQNRVLYFYRSNNMTILLVDAQPAPDTHANVADRRHFAGPAYTAGYSRNNGMDNNDQRRDVRFTSAAWLVVRVHDVPTLGNWWDNYIDLPIQYVSRDHHHNWFTGNGTDNHQRRHNDSINARSVRLDIAPLGGVNFGIPTNQVLARPFPLNGSITIGDISAHPFNDILTIPNAIQVREAAHNDRGALNRGVYRVEFDIMTPGFRWMAAASPTITHNRMGVNITDITANLQTFTEAEIERESARIQFNFTMSAQTVGVNDFGYLNFNVHNNFRIVAADGTLAQDVDVRVRVQREFDIVTLETVNDVANTEVRTPSFFTVAERTQRAGTFQAGAATTRVSAATPTTLLAGRGAGLTAPTAGAPSALNTLVLHQAIRGVNLNSDAERAALNPYRTAVITISEDASGLLILHPASEIVLTLTSPQVQLIGARVWANVAVEGSTGDPRRPNDPNHANQGWITFQAGEARSDESWYGVQVTNNAVTIRPNRAGNASPAEIRVELLVSVAPEFTGAVMVQPSGRAFLTQPGVVQVATVTAPAIGVSAQRVDVRATSANLGFITGPNLSPITLSNVVLTEAQAGLIPAGTSIFLRFNSTFAAFAENVSLIVGNVTATNGMTVQVVGTTENSQIELRVVTPSTAGGSTITLSGLAIRGFTGLPGMQIQLQVDLGHLSNVPTPGNLVHPGMFARSTMTATTVLNVLAPDGTGIGGDQGGNITLPPNLPRPAQQLRDPANTIYVLRDGTEISNVFDRRYNVGTGLHTVNFINARVVADFAGMTLQQVGNTVWMSDGVETVAFTGGQDTAVWISNNNMTLPLALDANRPYLGAVSALWIGGDVFIPASFFNSVFTLFDVRVAWEPATPFIPAHAVLVRR
jgi:hypothetical protein